MDMEDAEFFLPSEFLCDDFFLEGDKTGEAEAEVAGTCFSELCPAFDSNPSSPADGATAETEGDEEEKEEEDYMVGLAQQMARSFLQDDDASGSTVLTGNDAKAREVMACSPESTISPWSVSRNGNTNGQSLVWSPLSTPLEQHKDDAWDLLYEAMGKVMRLRKLHDNGNHHIHKGCGILRKPSPAIAAVSKATSTGYQHTPALTQRQLQFCHPKQQQLTKQQLSGAWGRQRRGRGDGGVYGEEARYGRPLGLPSSAWPPLQKSQQPLPGSGMRAVFLTGAGARKESTGTGVFLPRRVSSPTESRKKPACSTVLLPARVVQALNLNLEELGAQQGGFVLDHGKDLFLHKLEIVL